MSAQEIICPSCDGLGGHERRDDGWTPCGRCKGEGVVVATARTVFRDGSTGDWPWLRDVAGD